MTHWPTRLARAFSSASRLNANSRTLTPGRPSGVSSGGRTRSTDASASQAITLVAYPDIVRPAVSAQAAVSAVTTARAAVIGNASANVSTTSTPFNNSGGGGADPGWGVSVVIAGRPPGR